MCRNVDACDHRNWLPPRKPVGLGDRWAMGLPRSGNKCCRIVKRFALSQHYFLWWSEI